jgi:hypothetical protein
MAAATGSVAELLSRKVPLPAAATITPAAMQKRASGEGFRSRALRDNTEIGSRAASAGSRGGCPSAISTLARASSPCITGALARSDCRIILGAAVGWVLASTLLCAKSFGFCPLTDVFPSSSSPADVNQQKSEHGDIAARLDVGAVIISA